jgi:hypothetical protein
MLNDEFRAWHVAEDRSGDDGPLHFEWLHHGAGSTTRRRNPILRILVLGYEAKSQSSQVRMLRTGSRENNEMKTRSTKWIASALTSAIALLSGSMLIAQPPGPPPGGFGPGGFRGRGPGGPGFAGREFGPGGRQATVTNAPYSALETAQTTQLLANGTQITRNEQTQVYRDSQGRVRTDTTVTPPAGSTVPARTMVTIFDPVEGSISRLDSQRMVVEKSMLPTRDFTPRGPASRPGGGARADNIGRPAGAAAPQIQRDDLGTRTIAGVTATGKRTTTTIPAGTVGNSQAMQSVHETWISSDLQVAMMTTTSDPRFGTRVTQLTNVTRNEPDAGLFQVPSNYTVKTHSRPGGPRQ